MKPIAILLLCAVCSGCQTVEAVLDALGTPDPVPAASPANAGAVVNGRVCVQMSDGTWQWVSRKPAK
jgi:hypothetical protein